MDDSLETFERRLAELVAGLENHNPRIKLTCSWFTLSGTIFVRIARADKRQAWYFIRVRDQEMFGATDWNTPNFEINYWKMATFLKEVVKKN